VSDRPVTPQRRRAAPHERLLFLATAGCFAVPGATLLFGTLYLPLFLFAILDGHPFWAEPATRIVLGWFGTAGVARLLHLIAQQEPHDRWRPLTLLGLGCGVGVLLHHAWLIAVRQAVGGWIVLSLYVWIPLLCTAYLVWRARRPLFARP
jgi:hypothetical protein